MKSNLSKKILILGLIILLLCISYAFNRNHSYAERKMKMQFTEYSYDMKKEYTFTDFEGNLVLKYSQFSLERGNFVFQLCKGNQVEAESRVYSGDSSAGKIVFGLTKENEYTINLFAEDAHRGRIQVEW